LSNILCVRFKGIDPERILNWLYPKVRWFFSPFFVVLCLTMMVAAATSIAVNFDVFHKHLPTFYQFFSLNNAFWLAVALGCTKILHEFGHGLLCKHFGGECHEMGFMILVLTPCLYCNVSDSWMLPNKWRRAAIGAGGMYFELTLASIATFMWWASTPGFLHHLCLNIMFISSVSTVLFNANPLLRYDGYYILADITEIPNLRQKATTILSRKLAWWCLGIEPPDDPFLPQRRQMFFALYSIAAAVYRWFVVLSILWFLYHLGKKWRLEILGQIVTAWALWGLLAMPLYNVYKFFYVPGRLEKVVKWRMYLTLGTLASVAALILFLPLPHNVICSVEVQPRDAVPVYIDVPGRIERMLVKEGEHVTAGQPLAILRSAEVQADVERYRGQKEVAEAQLQSRIHRAFKERKAAEEVPQIKENLETAKRQLAEKEEDLRRLTLRAPIGGTVLPPPKKKSRHNPETQLPTWSGTPFDPENLPAAGEGETDAATNGSGGAYFRQGELFCLIGEPDKMEAILVIDQGDIEFVREGQDVELKLDESPHDTITHTELDGKERRLQIAQIANTELKISSQRLSGKTGGELATETDPETGMEKPQSTSYQARVYLGDPEHELMMGLRGRAKIAVDPQPLGKRFWRFVTKTFNFKL